MKTNKTETTQTRLAAAIAAKQADKIANPPMVAGAIARTERYAQPPDYTSTVEEISDSLRHIHSTLHVFATAMLAFMTRMEGAPVLVKVPEAETTPLGEVKPRRGRPAKVKAEPVVEEQVAKEAFRVEPEVPPEVEAIPEKPAAKVAVPTFEEMRAAAVVLAGKENGRARLTAILQAEAGVANLSGVTDEKRAAVVKALTEAAGG